MSTSQPLDYLLALLDLEVAKDPTAGVLHWQDSFIAAAEAWELEQCRQLLAHAKHWNLEPRLRTTIQQQAARLWRQLGDWGRATAQLDKVLQLHQTSADPQGEVIALNALANLLRLNVNRHTEALPLYRRALALTQDRGANAAKAATLNNLGLAHYEAGNHEEARACFDEALVCYHALNHQTHEAECLHNLGSVAWTQGRLNEAEQYFAQALDLLQSLGNRAGKAETLSGLGLVWEAQGQWEKATSTYRDALDILRERGDLYGQAQVLTNLGNAYWLLEDYDAATKCYVNGLDIARWLGEARLEGQLLTNLGDVYRSRSSFA